MQDVTRVRIGDIRVDGEYEHLQGGGRYKYIRGGPDWYYVEDLVRALRAGVLLAPITASSDLHLIEGMHRLLSHVKMFGPDGTIEVVTQDLSLQDAIRFAVRENIKHGLRLDRTDKIKISILAEELGISDEELAELFCVPRDTVQRMKGPRVLVVMGNSQLVCAAKPWMKHKDGQSMTPEEYRVVRSFAGNSPRELGRIIRDVVEMDIVDHNHAPSITMLQDMACAVLRDHLRNGLVDWNNRDAAVALEEIAREITRQIAQHCAQQVREATRVTAVEPVASGAAA